MNKQDTARKDILIKALFTGFVGCAEQHCTLKEFREWLEERNFDSLFQLWVTSRCNPDYVPVLIETGDGHDSDKRLDMVQLGIAGHRKMTVCKYEVAGGYPVEIFTSLELANFMTKATGVDGIQACISGRQALCGGWRWTTSLGKLGNWDTVNYHYVVNHAYEGSLMTLSKVADVAGYTGLNKVDIENAISEYGKTCKIGPWLIFMVRLAK